MEDSELRKELEELITDLDKLEDGNMEVFNKIKDRYNWGMAVAYGLTIDRIKYLLKNN